MKNISLSKLVVAVLSISAAQLCAYEFTVFNYLHVPIKVKMPLLHEPKDAEVLTIPAKGSIVYKPEGWFVGYCLDVRHILVAKGNEVNFVSTPVQYTDKYFLLTSEAQTSKDGRVKEVRGLSEGLGYFSIKGAFCGDLFIRIMEDVHGTLFALSRGYKD